MNKGVSFRKCCNLVVFNIIRDGVSDTFLDRSGFCSGERGGCKVKDRSSREAGVESTELDPSVLIEQGHIVTAVYSTERCGAVYFCSFVLLTAFSVLCFYFYHNVNVQLNNLTIGVRLISDVL